MKIELPHRKVNLDMNLQEEERMLVITKLLRERVFFGEEEIDLEEYFRRTFNLMGSKIAMNQIAYYITKENRVLEILSIKKEEEISRGSKRHTTFSAMSYEDQIQYGAIDPDDYQFN